MNPDNRYMARVYLTQARVFKRRGSSFYLTLLAWAKNAKRRSWQVQPGESGRLFG